MRAELSTQSPLPRQRGADDAEPKNTIPDVEIDNAFEDLTWVFDRGEQASWLGLKPGATNFLISTDFYLFLPISTDFYLFFGLSWETSTLKNYHPQDSKHSGSRRIEFSSKSTTLLM